MFEQADDDTLLVDGEASTLAVAAGQMLLEGDLGQLRAFLESANLAADEAAAMIYLKTIDRLDDHVTMQASVTEMLRRLEDARPSAKLLSFLLPRAERAVLPLPIIDDALSFARNYGANEGLLGQAYKAVRQRQRFRRNLAPRAAGVNFISLGMHCLPWTLVNRWGLRTPEQFVDELNPFCLATHRMPGVIKAIESDFSDYIAPDQITVVKSSSGRPVAMRRDRTAVWGHNQGAYWVADNCQALRENIQIKIEAFRQACRTGESVFLIGNCHDRYPDEALDFVPDLQRALRNMTGSDHNRIIITNQRADPPEKRLYHVDKYTSFFYCPYPDKNYTWFAPESADSDGGLVYERNYVRLLFGCLRRWGLLDVSATEKAG